MKKYLIAIVAIALLALPSCTPDITDVNVPEALNIAGAWAGSARWSGLQGLVPTVISSQDAAATMFQNAAAVQGTWEITGLWVGDLTGNIDPAGNFLGTMNVTVLGAGACSASAPASGTATDVRLELRVSYADPGSTPCAGAPVGLVLELGR